MVGFIVTYIICTIICVTMILKNFIDEDELGVALFVLSFVPFLNCFMIFIFVVIIVSAWLSEQKI